jgi:phage-related protein
MANKFEIIFLKQAIEFVENLDSKTRTKIYYNIDKSKLINDPKLFEKLEGEIWEFRTKYNKNQYRLFAFWDKTGEKETLVIATHGIMKKTSKTPKKEIQKAENIRLEYFKNINFK